MHRAEVRRRRSRLLARVAFAGLQSGGDCAARGDEGAGARACDAGADDHDFECEGCSYPACEEDLG